MKLLRRSTQSLTNPPLYQVALGDTALRGQLVKWIRPRGIGNSRPRFLLALTIVMMLVLSLSAAAQNQYYVSTSGSDSNNGTNSSTPWRTCSHAIAAFSLNGNGAVINFAPGNFAETCSVNRGGSSLKVRLVLKCSQQIVVGGGNNCRGILFNTYNANYVDIGALPFMGFEYTNPDSGVAVNNVAQCASGHCQNGNSIHVLGNYWHDIGQNSNGGCPFAGAFLSGQHGRQLDDTQAIGNVVDHYGIYPQSGCNGAHGIYIIGAGAVIQNNIITRAAYAGIQYYDAACSGIITNNVLVNNTAGIVAYGSNGCTAGLNTIANNVVANNSTHAFNISFSSDQGCTSGRQTLYTNNIVFGNPRGTFTHTPASCTTVQNQLSENPTATFVNYTGTASGDYHLKAGSIAVGGGTTQCMSGGATSCVPAVDFAAVSRPNNKPSLGVFEPQGDRNASAPSAPTGLTAIAQ
jgi:hypothetical protein